MIQRIAFVYLVALSFALASCAGDIGLADKANSNGTPLLTNPGDGDVELPPGDDGEDPAGEPGGEPNAGGGDPGEQITRDPTRDREYRGPRNAPPTK